MAAVVELLRRARRDARAGGAPRGGGGVGRRTGAGVVHRLAALALPELAEVRWFERQELERAARGQGSLALAPPYSIARRLIDAWLARG